MSSRRGTKPLAGSTSHAQSSKGKQVSEMSTSHTQSSKGKQVSEISSPMADQLSQGVAGFSLGPSQDDGGDWEVMSRKSKNKSGSNAAKSWASQNSNPRAWGHPGRNNNVLGRGAPSGWPAQAVDYGGSTGRGNIRPHRGYENNYVVPQPTIHPPLENGWNWQSRAGSTPSKVMQDGLEKDIHAEEEPHVDEEKDYESDALDDSDEGLVSDDYDSDSSQKSHDTQKKGKWFKKFFESLDSLTVEEINDPQREWHCPACQNGPGAIDWYGLQPLITHARTKGSRRVKLHRELAVLLDEELRRRGTSAIPAGEAFGHWKGLKEEEKDYEIVWPPMVVIMNTRLDKDENDKWLGMGNQELLDYFSGYDAAKARHSYGPQGHRGMSILIFESSAKGYFEAERLDRHFSEQGTDRDAWERRRVFFHCGKRQLYGFLAMKEDLDIFNQHSLGKSRLKFEMKSYQEMVVKELRQMSEDNQQLNWFKNKLTKQHKHTKTLEESLGILSEKLRKTAEENRIVRQRTKMQHEQNKKEMDFQDKFYKEQIKVVHEARDAKEEDFEKIQQLERAKVQQQNANPSGTDDYRRRAEEISKFIKFQEKEMEEFVGEREKLIEEHEKKMAEMRRRHCEEELELEREFDNALGHLMDKFIPPGSDATSINRL